MEDSATKLRLQWRDHGNELSKLSREIFGNDDLTDVTLTCRGGSPYHAHKMVLAAASTYFRNFFKEIQCKMPQHQVIFMKDVEPAELEYLLQFIYLGEVDIPSTDLERLITISRELGIVGLNTVKNEDEETVERSIPKVAKRKYAPTPKPPPMKQQPQEAPTHKKLKVKMDPEPIYEEEEQEQEEDEESQDFIDAYMDGDGGEDNDDEAEDDDNVEDANEKEEVCVKNPAAPIKTDEAMRAVFGDIEKAHSLCQRIQMQVDWNKDVASQVRDLVFAPDYHISRVFNDKAPPNSKYGPMPVNPTPFFNQLYHDIVSQQELAKEKYKTAREFRKAIRKSMNNAKQYKNRDKAAMMEQQWKKRCDKREKKRSSDCQVDGMSFVSISC